MVPGETRTLTVSLPADFESAASTIPPPRQGGRTIIRVFQRRASRDQATHVETMPVGYHSTLSKTRKTAC